ncbi:hypothetical protein PTKIN_Ptkin03bG0101400 [Pterospermum kingtungense]
MALLKKDPIMSMFQYIENVFLDGAYYSKCELKYRLIACLSDEWNDFKIKLYEKVISDLFCRGPFCGDKRRCVIDVTHGKIKEDPKLRSEVIQDKTATSIRRDFVTFLLF